jgi:hypothetical protein
MKRFALGIAVMLLCAANAYPAGSKLLKWKLLLDFSKAHIENVMVDPKGFASLSYGIDTLFESAEVFLWDCDFDSRGNIYVASGNEGKVFRISPTHQVFTTFAGEQGAEIFAVAVDANDNVYIGESPSGIIYRINRAGKEEEYFATGEQYIWDMRFDAGGTLFAATGDRGKLYRISQEGKGEVYYSSTENHIVKLLFYRGKLYAGTEPNGLFIEIVEKDRAVVHYDTDENEVHAMVGIEDDIYFATISEPLSSSPASYSSFFGPGAMEMGKMEKSVLYRFDLKKQSVIPLWDCVTPPIYTITAGTGGDVFVGTDRGKLYQAFSDGRIGFVNQFGEAPVLAVVPKTKGKDYIVLTGNLGSMLRLGPDLAKVGTIESHVIDTERKSVFGRIDWDVDVPPGTQFSVWVRVGNRESPDEDWSVWKEMRRGTAINLAPARFIQVKCEFRTASSGKSPLFRDISISYLPENRAPFIAAFVVCPVGINASEGYDPFGGAKIPLSEKEMTFYMDLGYDLPPTLYVLEKGKRCAIWQALDPDGDSLTFTFFYRGEKEKQWKELKKDVVQSSVIWDETAFPDGKYHGRIIASDSRDNPPERALEIEMESEPFIVDNTAPSVHVESIQARGDEIQLTVSAEDELSLLKEASYSINAGEWQVVLPEDGIFDSKSETFVVRIKDQKPGEYTVVFKVTDLSLNIGTGKGTTEIK